MLYYRFLENFGLNLRWEFWLFSEWAKLYYRFLEANLVSSCYKNFRAKIALLSLINNSLTLYADLMSTFCIQIMMMLSAGYFRIRSDLPGPIWAHPMSYIAFHTYSIQASICFPSLIDLFSFSFPLCYLNSIYLSNSGIHVGHGLMSECQTAILFCLNGSVKVSILHTNV